MSERSGTECRMMMSEGMDNMQHIAWSMQHGMIFTYLINGCEIPSGGNSEVPNEREKDQSETRLVVIKIFTLFVRARGFY